MSRVFLVTGAGRGIGAEICRQRLAEGDTVVACPRGPDAPDLEALRPGPGGGADAPRSEGGGGTLHVVPMDVADDASIARTAAGVAQRVDGIDVLVNNAGVYPRETVPLADLETEVLVHAYRVNAVGPLRVVAALLPLLRRGRERRILQLTSRMGSIDDNRSGGSYAYRMSKAALNMAVRNLAHELGPEGFVVLAIHPGWVATRMGGWDRAPLSVAEAAAEVVRIGLAADVAASGTMVGPGGERIAW